MGKFGAALALVFCAGSAGADCAPDAVELRTAGGSVVRFSVELADDEAERALGLMNRQRMASSAGMLFAYQAPRHAYFWMKNTLIPLDIIFVRNDATIARIEANAAPLSLDPIPAGEPVAAVLELAGGRAAELGITPGARVEWPR